MYPKTQFYFLQWASLIDPSHTKKMIFWYSLNIKVLQYETIVMLFSWSREVNGPKAYPQKLFSTMDLDSDYYSSRCKDINGLWVFKGTFIMTFVGGDSDH